jgi:hypothetical protein
MAATALNLRCKEWSSFKVLAPSAGYTAGQMLKINDTVGVIVDTAAVTVQTAFIYKAKKILVPSEAVPTGSGGSGSSGSKVYFDSTNARITFTASGNTLCGILTEDAVVGATSVEIDLDGTLGIVS